MKKAVIIASVGTTLAESEQRTLQPIEDAIQSAFPDRIVARTFTSNFIRRRLAARGILVDSPEKAIERMKNEGCEDIIFAATHIIPGVEYSALLSSAGKHKVSEPLLACDSDLQWMAQLLSTIHAEEHQLLLAVGHGSDHDANHIYEQLKKYLPENIFLACLKGENTLNSLLPTLTALPQREITLFPLMLAAGKHAQDDLAAGEQSWKSILESHGFHVRIRMQGLGELSAVQLRIAEKTLKAANS